MEDAVRHGAEAVSVLMSLWALHFTARRSLWGPILGASALIPWTVFAVLSASPFLAALNFVFAGVHLNNLIHWKRHA